MRIILVLFLTGCLVILRAGIPLLATISAPTSLAIQLAQKSRLILAGFARDTSLVAYSHPERISLNREHVLRVIPDRLNVAHYISSAAARYLAFSKTIKTATQASSKTNTTCNHHHHHHSHRSLHQNLSLYYR